MSRVISFRDLRLIGELSQYNEIELLHPNQDAQVNYYLEQLGFNTAVGVLYVPNIHRDLQGKVALGFRAVGEINPASPYIDSPLCTLIERILAAAVKDISMAKEMSMMLGNSINFAIQGADELYDQNQEEFPLELVEPDFEEVTDQIKFLEGVRDQLRGSCYNEYGNLKTPKEYQGVPA